MEQWSALIESLLQHAASGQFQGWDPFDGLNSRLFKSSPLYGFPPARLAWLQFFKRSPINFRKIALVPKGTNAKGLALFASGLTALGRQEEARSLLDRLKGMTCAGYAGASWGYNFDWQTRAFYVPIGTPNMVTTVFVANAFLDYCELTGKREALELAVSACDFILGSLTIHEDEEVLCLGYVPSERAVVHNANMLGAALLARVYSHTGSSELCEKSRKAMTYSVRALTPEGSWPYGELPHHRFIDSFHTGYNLVALKTWMRHTGEAGWEPEISKAYKYFLENFWLENGCPRYYHNSLFPIDVHCSAQGIITCLELAAHDDRSLPLARKIVRWVIDNMQDSEGFFYYQKHEWYTNRIPYMRWSQAWMFLGLSQIQKRLYSI